MTRLLWDNSPRNLTWGRFRSDISRVGKKRAAGNNIPMLEAGSEMAPAQLETTRIKADRETARLAALESLAILDTPPEPGYDAITRLAADYFAADSALI